MDIALPLLTSKPRDLGAISDDATREAVERAKGARGQCGSGGLGGGGRAGCRRRGSNDGVDGLSGGMRRPERPNVLTSKE